jgi:hypothetical protein
MVPSNNDCLYRKGEGVIATAGPSASIKYTCTSTHGAMLTLADKFAMSYDLGKKTEKQFVQYVLHNLETIAPQCGCELQDLVAVTGCTLTGDWEAVVLSSSSKGAGFDVLGGAPTLLPLSAGVSLQVSSQQSHQTSRGHYHNPERIGPNCCGLPKNQCIFIRSYKFKKRLFKPKAIQMRAAAGYHEYKKNRDGSWGSDGRPKVPSTSLRYGFDETTFIQAEKIPPPQKVKELFVSLCHLVESTCSRRTQQMNFSSGFSRFLYLPFSFSVELTSPVLE